MNTKVKILIAATLSILANASHAQIFCVFDPSGTQGDSFSMMKDYSLSAKQWSRTHPKSIYR